MTISHLLATLAGRDHSSRRGSGGLAHMIEHALIWSTVSHLVGHFLPQIGVGVVALAIGAAWVLSRMRRRRPRAR